MEKEKQQGATSIAELRRQILVEAARKRRLLKKQHAASGKTVVVAVFGHHNGQPFLADVVKDGYLIEQLLETANLLPVLWYFVLAYLPPDLSNLHVESESMGKEASARVKSWRSGDSWHFAVRRFNTVERASAWLREQVNAFL